MKTLLFYSSLFFILNACSTDTTTNIENNSKETQTQKVDQLQLNNKVISPEVKGEEEKETVGAPIEKRDCNPSHLLVFLSDSDLSGTNIRKHPGGEVIMKIVRSEENPEYMFALTEAQNGWFKIKGTISGMDNQIKIPNDEGWIHSSVIGVETRNYGGQELKLLDQPEGEKVVGLIKEQSYGLKIKDLCGEWVKVEHKGVTGWIESEWLCGNPVTTCS